MESTRRAYLTYEIRWPDRNSFVQNRDNYRQTRRVTFSLSPSLSLSLYLASSTSSLTLWSGRFGLFVASIFFVVFHFEQPRFTPGPSTIPPFESPSRIERIPSNYLTLRTVASVCLSVEIHQNPAYRNASCTRWQFHRLSYYHWTVKANQARAK